MAVRIVMPPRKFIAATNHDRKFRAFDKATGELLWETVLPAAGNATPATYEVNGKQYVVIAAGGGKWGSPSGGTYVAFAVQGTGNEQGIGNREQGTGKREYGLGISYQGSGIRQHQSPFPGHSSLFPIPYSLFPTQEFTTFSNAALNFSISSREPTVTRT